MQYAPNDGRQRKLNKINMHGDAPLRAFCHQHIPVDWQKFLRHANIPLFLFEATTLTFVLNIKATPRAMEKNQRLALCVFFFAFDLTFMLAVAVVVGYTCTVLGSTSRVVWKQAVNWFVPHVYVLMDHGHTVMGHFLCNKKMSWSWILFLGVEERRFQIPTFCFISVQANPKGSHVKLLSPFFVSFVVCVCVFFNKFI